MKTSIKLLTCSILLATGSASAANYAIEARGEAMGGVGVVSANFLTAPFYNPALTAIYRRNDDVGMLIPSVGLTYNDEDGMVDELDRVSDLIDSQDPNRIPELEQSLDNLTGTEVKADLGGAVAFAIPNKFVAANVFGKLYTESYATPQISDDADIETRARNSTVNAVSIGVAEAGISLAKYQTFLGQHIAFGITPKLQRIYTYVYEASLDDYDIKDIRDNDKAETMFNMDAGALWFYGPFRIGFAATNLVSRDIETKTIASRNGGTLKYEYQMKPQYTVGAGIVADYFTLSVDYDLNEEERYKDFDDNTQWIRVGGEIDVLRQLQLRAGYKKNLAYSDQDGTVTAGIGLSPLNLFQMDIGASYTNEDAMGVYLNFLGSY